jgi:hypothetical protein
MTLWSHVPARRDAAPCEKRYNPRPPGPQEEAKKQAVAAGSAPQRQVLAATLASRDTTLKCGSLRFYLNPKNPQKILES